MSGSFAQVSQQLTVQRCDCQATWAGAEGRAGGQKAPVTSTQLPPGRSDDSHPHLGLTGLLRRHSLCMSRGHHQRSTAVTTAARLSGFKPGAAERDPEGEGSSLLHPLPQLCVMERRGGRPEPRTNHGSVSVVLALGSYQLPALCRAQHSLVPWDSQQA